VNPVLLLVDLQNDFLAAPGLQPSAPGIVARSQALLEAFRAQALPIVHVWTTIRAADDCRMPHWKQAGKWACVEGSIGHKPPAPLSPRPSELVQHKTFFSAFEDGLLDQALRSWKCSAVIIAGVHLHGCVRATVLDAYQRGYAVWVADDATGSDDPLHAAITRRYLQERAARFAPTQHLLQCLHNGHDLEDHTRAEILIHHSPRNGGQSQWQVPIAGRAEAAAAADAAQKAWPAWRDTEPECRAEVLRRLAGLLPGRTNGLARKMAEELGKPITQGAAEVGRSVDLLKDISQRAGDEFETRTAADASFRYRPLGVVAVVSPWNNPLAIPLGKIAPALIFGNAVVWKPAPAATALAAQLMELLMQSGCPKDAIRLVSGDHRTAQYLAAADGIDAVTLSGSAAAGLALQEICARRHVPFQAELGGNNAAIVWEDADLPDAAQRTAEAAFGFAGQRCTANRRVIVAASRWERFLKELERATAALGWGDPLEGTTQVGPVISMAKRDEIAALVARARPAAEAIIVPHAGQANRADLEASGCYFAPTIVVGPAPGQEIVQEESFGPVLVVQRAGDFDNALALCNAVRQGLVAALFSSSRRLQERFLQEARAGILKLNRATADADACTPFGGWKASGVGPPEHGPSDREFFTRTQAVYHRPA
jgi:acyl-CoA reductase-like NAD-dependent aldehyde dehydrogenase/nicotinamidase-related amidase